MPRRVPVRRAAGCATGTAMTEPASSSVSPQPVFESTERRDFVAMDASDYAKRGTVGAPVELPDLELLTHQYSRRAGHQTSRLLGPAMRCQCRRHFAVDHAAHGRIGQIPPRPPIGDTARTDWRTSAIM